MLDDYHMGVLVCWIPLTPLSWFLGKVRGALRRLRVPLYSMISSLPDLALSVMRQRMSGVKRAIDAYCAEHENTCRLELIPMPSRGSYQGSDYALAIISFREIPDISRSD